MKATHQALLEDRGVHEREITVLKEALARQEKEMKRMNAKLARKDEVLRICRNAMNKFPYQLNEELSKEVGRKTRRQELYAFWVGLPKAEQIRELSKVKGLRGLLKLCRLFSSRSDYTSSNAASFVSTQDHTFE